MKNLIRNLVMVLFVSHGVINAQTNKVEDTGNIGIGTVTPAYPLHILGSTNTLRIHKGGGYSPLHFYSDGDGTHNGSPIHISTYGYGGSQDLNFRIQNWGGYYNFKFGATGGSYDAVRITKGGGGGNGPNLGFGILEVMGLSQEKKVRLNGNGDSYIRGGALGVGIAPTGGALHVMKDLTMGNWGSISTNNATVKIEDSGAIMYLDGNTIYADALMNIGTIGNHDLTLGTNDTPRITIENNGKVGIGTAPSNSQLHVYRNETTGGWGTMTTSKSGLRIQDSGANLYMDGNSMVTNGNMLVGTTEARYISFGTNGTERMRMFANGNLAIGIESDHGYKLHVDGKAIMEEVKVELSTSWPDYVFTPSYDLQSLDQVETFINENGHLPNIPSAQEVEENNGIELGEMNAKLLEKIEELTLYQIQLMKELKSLKAENQAQQKEIDQLKSDK